MFDFSGGSSQQQLVTNLNKISPELRLLLVCLKIHKNSDDIAVIHHLSQSIEAWPAFLVLVERHCVAPLVYQQLSHFSSVPSTVHKFLQQKFHKNALRAVLLAGEMIQLIELLKTQGIDVFPLKGLTLALNLYGDFTVRHVGDIDLLIAPEQVIAADRILRNQGYQRKQPNFELNSFQYRQIKNLWHQFEYAKQAIYLDLHWRLSYNAHLLDIGFSELQARAQTVVLANRNIPVLSGVDNLLFLCAHGARHAWCHLFWLVDIAASLQCRPPLDWINLLQQAEKYGCTRSLIQGVFLAHCLLDSPLPEAVQLAIMAELPTIKYLVQAALRYIHLPTPLSIREVLKQKLYYDFQLSPNWAYKVELIKHGFLHPADWKTLPLPDKLFWLYYGLGPGLWLLRQWGIVR